MALTDSVGIPGNINTGVSCAKQITMLSLLGNPRGHYDQSCHDVTNPDLKALMVTENVGSFRITGLLPAVQSLKDVLSDIKSEEAAVFNALGTEGMLCARFVRNSTTSISNHSWGTAIDLTLEGRLDPPGDRKVQKGLAIIAPIFNRHGWFWGAGFSNEDGMHFEVSEQKIREWHASGRLVDSSRPAPDSALSLGDRGPEVKTLQERLNALGSDLKVDGDFGRNTLAAVMAFQAAKGLNPDGIVGPLTRGSLGI